MNESMYFLLKLVDCQSFVSEFSLRGGFYMERGLNTTTFTHISWSLGRTAHLGFILFAKDLILLSNRLRPRLVGTRKMGIRNCQEVFIFLHIPKKNWLG